MFHADRRADKAKLIVVFRNFPNAPKNKQNKDGQNEKRKNTGNMWDPKHNIVGTKEKNRMEHAHIENGRRSTSKKSS